MDPDPDPVGPKTPGSFGSGSATLVERILLYFFYSAPQLMSKRKEARHFFTTDYYNKKI
jgi:hypothetical protein